MTVELFRRDTGAKSPCKWCSCSEIYNKICDVALCLSDEELKAMSWTTFVSGCTQPELVQYLKERRLYVNEPVETEVEL